jgi:hypothetical protein
MPVNCLSSSGLRFYGTRRSHTFYRELVSHNDMVVTNGNFNVDELGVNWHSSRLTRVDRAKVEAEFFAQCARLIHRLRDRDYPYPEVIN